jgi:hypothetical protein
MKVRFKKNISGTGFRFRQGAEVELPSDMAKDFLQAGFCEAIAEPPKQRAKKSVAKTTKKETR